MERRIEGISRERFIRLGGALGVSVAGAAVLAACGTGSSEQSANGSDRNETTGAKKNKDSTRTSGNETTGHEKDEARESEAEASEEKTPGGREIARASKVPANSALEFTDSGNPAVLIHLQNGGFVAYSAVCTHQGCTVAYERSTGLLACPCHGSVFDPSSGAAVVNGPAQVPLPSIPVEVQGGEVYRS